MPQSVIMLRRNIAIVLCVFALCGTLFGQTFVNGSLNSGACPIPGSGNLPASWLNYSGNVDTYQNGNSSCNNCALTHPASPNGGAYTGAEATYLTAAWGGPLFSGEGMTQLVSGLTIGQTYCISFYQAYYNIWDCFGMSKNGGLWRVLVDLPSAGTYSLIGSSPAMNVGAAWTQVAQVFKATRTAHNIAFQAGYTGAPANIATYQFPNKVYVLIDGITLSTIASGVCSVLPVELLTYNLICDNGKPFLYWKADKENNLDFYTIERSSNGKQWQIMTKIMPPVKSGIKQYFWIDTTIVKDSITYYRLNLADHQGVIKQMETKALLNCNDPEGFSDITIYPNPTKEEIEVKSNYEISSVELFRTESSSYFKEVYPKSPRSVKLKIPEAGVFYLKVTFLSGNMQVSKIAIIR